MKVLILTPLPLEYDAVVRHLTGERTSVIQGAAAYEMGAFTGKHHVYEVVVREPGMKNVDMALATEKAIQYFQPQIVLLIGIAGGVKDVRIGDVLIAKKVYGYESGKEDADGFKARPAVESFSGDLLAHAQQLSRQQAWKKRTGDGAPDAKIFIGPIAAGDKVVAGMNNPIFQRIKLHYNDTLGLEMEAIGFATALQGHRHIHGLVIRGISDLCEGKSETDKRNWQVVAAERAAAVGFEMLGVLNLSNWLLERPSGNHDSNNKSRRQLDLSPSMKTDLEEMIAYGEVEDAINRLKQYMDQNGSAQLRQQVLQLSERWSTHSRNVHMGTITHSNAEVERSRIVHALIYLISTI